MFPVSILDTTLVSAESLFMSSPALSSISEILLRDNDYLFLSKNPTSWRIIDSKSILRVRRTILSAAIDSVDIRKNVAIAPTEMIPANPRDTYID
jgi:hypothetical protein